MRATVDAVQRFSKRHRCPICGGHNQLASGRGERCYGYLGADGRYAHCTREEHACGLPQENGGSYAHRLDGPCNCGRAHGTEPGRLNGDHDEPLRRRVIRERRWQHALVAGEPIVHIRLDYDDGTKRMWWQRGGENGLRGYPVTDLPLYGVDDIGDAKGVIVVEGEPARDALDPLARELGLAVVGTVTGAKTRPSDDVLRALPAVPVYLWPDSDADGEKHAGDVADAMVAIGRRADEVRRLVWPNARPGEGDDAADFVKAGGTVDDLAALDTPAWHGRKAPQSESSPSANGEARLVIRALADVTPEPVDWLWYRWLARGKLHLLVGTRGREKRADDRDRGDRLHRWQVA